MSKQIYISLLTLLVSGCASLATEDSITKRTAFALSLDKSEFTITNRKNDGAQATYQVTTKQGRKYNCYVEGTFSYLTGPDSSDAICHEIGASKKETEPCNKLLKAAGKC